MIDYAAINAALYNRVATHTDGAAVRALAGANGIFERAGLRNTTGKVFPWFVWSEIDGGGASGDMRPMTGSWWIYVASSGNAFQLLTIAAALETLYGYSNAKAITGGRTTVVFKGRAFEDEGLTALGMEVRISYEERG